MLDVRTALRRSAGWNRDRVAIISGDRQLTFAQAWERGLRLANGLAASGLRPGDRVAVLEDNCLESADFFLGVAAGGFVRVPLYRRNSRESHAHMMGHTNCRAVVVAEHYLHEIEGLDAELEDLNVVIVRDGSYADWLASFPAVDPDPAIALDDLHLIRHSAGTTGKPKGIPFSHRSWMSTERDWMVGLPPIDPGDRCQHAGPISHGSGYLFVPVWLAGATNILESKFDAERSLEILAEHGGYFFAVPTMLADMIDRAQGRAWDFSRLKAIVVSASPIRRPTALAAHELFGDTLYQLYGQTEAVPVAFMGPREWFADVPGSDPVIAAGRVVPFAEIDIRDDLGHSLPVGSEGEIAIRCDGQTHEIWNEPEMTAARIRDGWVLTGDIGRIDENGYVYVTDRKDDLIISGGFNIWPAELEQVICELPGVREVAVFGVPHERWGETPLALVVMADDAAELTEADVIDGCTRRLGSYKKPGTVRFQTESLPRSVVGKIQRKVLRAPYWDGAERFVSGA